MATATFKGGIHPFSDFKQLSCDLPIEVARLPQQVVLPLSQHVGAPAEAIVEAGQQVTKGELIAKSTGFVSANIHATISGTVSAIEPRPHSMGGLMTAIVIDSDGQDEWFVPPKDDRSDNLSADDIRDRVHAAGIVGLGGASFPAHVKLSPPDSKPVDTLIINGAECEPYLTCDYRMMLEQPAEVVDGTRLAMVAAGATKGCIGIEDNKPEAIKSMREACNGQSDIEVVALETKYPQGQEHQIITAITGREIPSGGLPMDIGLCVHNVATVIAISRAVRQGAPLIERVLTITGDGVERPGNLLVRGGTSIDELLESRGLKDNARKLLLGGPMMGTAQYTTGLPTLKATSGLLVMTDVALYESEQCIRCGECVAHCPMRLVPSALSILCEAQDIDGAAANDILDCKLCGCCTYVCPARRPIVHQIKFGQAELRKRKKP